MDGTDRTDRWNRRVRIKEYVMNRSLGDERTVKWVDNSRLCARCMDPHSGAGEFETMEETVSGECERQLEKRVGGVGSSWLLVGEVE